VEGSDWDLIRKKLKPQYLDRLRFDVPKSNPKERSRINAMNSRLKTMSGDLHLKVDPRAVNTIKDFEGVRALEGSAGEIDKKADKNLSHLTDALGYYVERKFPVNKHVTRVIPV
jgi:hypothetical protein